jgi:hypothetical protein
LALLD